MRFHTGSLGPHDRAGEGYFAGKTHADHKILWMIVPGEERTRHA
jgi:hypothetical protein